MDDFKFSLPGLDQEKRNAFRATIPGLEAYVRERRKYYVIHDLSATGMGIKVDPGQGFKEGMSFDCDLYLNKRLYLGGLRATIMRITSKMIAGCEFAVMDTRKEARLDKLVLEVQKRLIALRKARKQKD